MLSSKRPSELMDPLLKLLTPCAEMPLDASRSEPSEVSHSLRWSWASLRQCQEVRQGKDHRHQKRQKRSLQGENEIGNRQMGQDHWRTRISLCIWAKLVRTLRLRRLTPQTTSLKSNTKPNSSRSVEEVAKEVEAAEVEVEEEEAEETKFSGL